MSHSEKDTLPPSYIDTMSSPPTHSLLTQLSQTRTTHIHSTVDIDILPLISHRASLGIAQTTIALLPSDIPLPTVPEKSEFDFDPTDTKAVEVIGFSSDDEPQVVRLEGQMNRTEFWRVKAVVEELEKVLRERLNGIRGEMGVVEEVVRQAPRRGLLSRMMSPMLGVERKSPGGNPEVGVRRMESVGGTMLVTARVEEICLRTMNKFGLFETMARQCVVIRVDARC